MHTCVCMHIPAYYYYFKYIYTHRWLYLCVKMWGRTMLWRIVIIVNCNSVICGASSIETNKLTWFANRNQYLPAGRGACR